MSLLVTGAGRGIGSAIVALAQARGETVIAHDVSAESLARIPAGVRTLTGDLTDPVQLDRVVKLAEQVGVTAVLAAHGVTGAIAFDDLEEQASRRVMRINCSSIIRMTRELWPHLARVQGAVVIVASQAALRPERENSIDCASKWALLYWAQAVGDVARGDGFAIRVLCPGRTDSAMLLEANRRIARTPSLSAGDYARATTQAIPLKRYASVDEIASAALLLAGPPGAALPRILAVTGGEVFS